MKLSVCSLPLGIVLAVGVVAGCTTPSAPASAEAIPASPAASAQGSTTGLTGRILAISLSNHTAEDQAVLDGCHVGDHDLVPIANVTGMGKIASPKDLSRYVPLTGREPQLLDDGPAWIVTTHMNLAQPGGDEVWTDPTCVATRNELGWYATGPVTIASTGSARSPEPPKTPPDLIVPPLAP